MSWRCGVCDGLNEGGETCAICGASRATAAVPVDRRESTTPLPPQSPPAPSALDKPRPPMPPRRRGLLDRLADAAASAMERALTLPPPSHGPPPDLDPDPEPAPRRRRSRLRVRPFPFGLAVTWESDPEEDSR